MVTQGGVTAGLDTEACAEGACQGLGEGAAWLGRTGLQRLPVRRGSLVLNDVSLVSLKLCNMATDSWEASADKAQMPRWWDGGSLASKQNRTQGSWPRPLDGPGPWSPPLPQLPRGGPLCRGSLFGAVTASQALCRQEGRAGGKDRPLSFTHPSAKCSDTGLSRPASWGGHTPPWGPGQSRVLGQPPGRVERERASPLPQG